MKVSKDFSLHEFVPPMIYEQYVDRAIWFGDPRLFTMAQFIRDRFGKAMTINNYLSGGTYQYLAFRDHLCTIGAVNSQHRHGRAFDFRIKGVTKMVKITYQPIEKRSLVFQNIRLRLCLDRKH